MRLTQESFFFFIISSLISLSQASNFFKYVHSSSYNWNKFQTHSQTFDEFIRWKIGFEQKTKCFLSNSMADWAEQQRSTRIYFWQWWMSKQCVFFFGCGFSNSIWKGKKKFCHQLDPHSNFHKRKIHLTPKIKITFFTSILCFVAFVAHQMSKRKKKKKTYLIKFHFESFQQAFCAANWTAYKCRMLLYTI